MIEFYDSDIVCLVETHLNKDNEYSVDFKDYEWFPHSRLTKHVRAAIHHGGVGLLVKKSILDEFSFHVLDKSFDGLLVTKFVSKTTEFEFVIFVCYIPPEGSPWSHNISDYLGHLVSEVYAHYESDLLFIVGDFNGRSGGNNGPLIETYVEDNIRERIIIDKVRNSQGIAFFDFLSDIRFCVLNGRFENDNFTCISERGSSVVDYVAVPYNSLDSCVDFRVIPALEAIDVSNAQRLIGEKSRPPDHSLLICKFNVSGFKEISSQSDAPREYLGRKRRYNLQFIPDDFCNNDVFRTGLLEAIDNLQALRISQESVDVAYKEFCDSLLAEMDKYLEYDYVNYHVKKRLRIHKPFWDQELTELWKVMKDKNKLYTKEKKSGGRTQIASPV